MNDIKPTAQAATRPVPAEPTQALGGPAPAPVGPTTSAAHERIVDAARDLFCRHGIHATGIDKILAVAGASKMTLYSHFGSKDALLREVLLREGADWQRSFFAAMRGAGGDAESQLRGIMTALGSWYQGGRFYGCAFMNAIAEHDKSEEWLRQIAAAHHSGVLGFLSATAAEAGYREYDILARQLLLLIDGATAALMVTSDAAVLAIASRNLSAILDSASRSEPRQNGSNPGGIG